MKKLAVYIIMVLLLDTHPPIIGCNTGQERTPEYFASKNSTIEETPDCSIEVPLPNGSYQINKEGEWCTVTRRTHCFSHTSLYGFAIFGTAFAASSLFLYRKKDRKFWRKATVFFGTIVNSLILGANYHNTNSIPREIKKDESFYFSETPFLNSPPTRLLLHTEKRIVISPLLQKKKTTECNNYYPETTELKELKKSALALIADGKKNTNNNFRFLAQKNFNQYFSNMSQS